MQALSAVPHEPLQVHSGLSANGLHLLLGKTAMCAGAVCRFCWSTRRWTAARQTGHALVSAANKTVLCMQALSAALLEHPEVNSSLSEDGQQLRVHHAHNVGIAMATNSGLVVPNIKHVEAQSVASIAAELKRLQQLASTGRLPAEDLAGERCVVLPQTTQQAVCIV